MYFIHELKFLILIHKREIFYHRIASDKKRVLITPFLYIFSDIFDVHFFGFCFERLQKRKFHRFEFTYKSRKSYVKNSRSGKVVYFCHQVGVIIDDSKDDNSV